MESFEQHERRLAAALTRIGAAAAQLRHPVDTGHDQAALEAEVARLTQELSAATAARTAAADDRAALEARHAADVAALNARSADLLAQFEAQGSELQTLRQHNAELRLTLRELREQISAGITDADQINRTLLAEVEALHHARERDSAELDQIIAALDPLVSGPAAPPLPLLDRDDGGHGDPARDDPNRGDNAGA